MPPQGRGSGSRLVHLLAAQKQARAAGQQLGLSERGGPTRQRPGPPVKAPADRPNAQRQAVREAGQAPAGEAADDVPADARQRMRERATEFLTSQQAAGTSPPSAGRVQPQSVKASINDELLRQRAQNLSPELQFARLAGRPGSPREVAIFHARQLLQKQLGRLPTTNEIKTFITRPEAISPSFPLAFEASTEEA